MYFEKEEILHLGNKKSYKVNDFECLNDIYYYLLENIDNHKYIVVTCQEINSSLYLKEVKDEDLLRKLNFR